MSNRKWLFLSSTLLIFSMNSVSFANNAAPTSECTKYLNYSDNQFNATIANNQHAAIAAATALGECQIANACSNITGLDHCATTLANRLFASEYYSNYNPASNAINSISFSSSPDTKSNFSAHSTKKNKAIIVPTPSTSATKKTPTPTTDKNNNSSNSKSSSSIHWF